MMLQMLLELLIFTFKFTVVLWKSIIEGFRSWLFPIRKDVSDDVVVITGAGSGLGQLMCVRFAKLGSTVVGWDISEAGLEATKNMVMEETGVKMHTYVCDVSVPESIYDTATKTRNDVNKHISILINNAGIVTGKLLLEMPDSLIEKVFKVNAISHFWTTKAVLPEMMSRRRGHLVFIASCAGWFGARRLTEYCASKAADVIFAESLTAELEFGGHSEIKVTCVCPWFITTGMFAGCESKYPGILPNLKPDETVDQIVDAVLREQNLIAMPRIVYLMYALKTMISSSAQMELYKESGANTFMDSFIGRSAKID